MKHLVELREFLSETATRCRAKGWFGALCRVEVAQEIAADVGRDQEKIAVEAYSAEQCDLEAARLIEEAGRDGFSNADAPALAKALRLIRRSAQVDHDITEVVRA